MCEVPHGLVLCSKLLVPPSPPSPPRFYQPCKVAVFFGQFFGFAQCPFSPQRKQMSQSLFHMRLPSFLEILFFCIRDVPVNIVSEALCRSVSLFFFFFAWTACVFIKIFLSPTWCLYVLTGWQHQVTSTIRDLGWILSQSILPTCLLWGEERSCGSGTLLAGRGCFGAWAPGCGTSTSGGPWCCSGCLLVGGEESRLETCILRHWDICEVLSVPASVFSIPLMQFSF